MEELETVPAGSSFQMITDHPYMLIGAAVVIVALLIYSRMIFANTQREYVYDPHQ